MSVNEWLENIATHLSYFLILLLLLGVISAAAISQLICFQFPKITIDVIFVYYKSCDFF